MWRIAETGTKRQFLMDFAGHLLQWSSYRREQLPPIAGIEPGLNKD